MEVNTINHYPIHYYSGHVHTRQGFNLQHFQPDWREFHQPELSWKPHLNRWIKRHFYVDSEVAFPNQVVDSISPLYNNTLTLCELRMKYHTGLELTIVYNKVILFCGRTDIIVEFTVRYGMMGAIIGEEVFTLLDCEDDAFFCSGSAIA